MERRCDFQGGMVRLRLSRANTQMLASGFPSPGLGQAGREGSSISPSREAWEPHLALPDCSSSSVWILLTAW